MNLYYFFYKYRGTFMVPPVAFILLWSKWEVENEWAVWIPGLVVFILGWGLRMWSQVHLRYRVNLDRKLTMTGPYAFVRNPIYIANTFCLLGLTMMCELHWFCPAMLLWCAFVYRMVVSFEEKHLEERYGARYLEYKRKVPRWFPSPGEKTSIRDICSKLKSDYLLRSVAVEIHVLVLLLIPLLKELFPPV